KHQGVTLWLLCHPDGPRYPASPQQNATHGGGVPLTAAGCVTAAGVQGVGDGRVVAPAALISRHTAGDRGASAPRYTPRSPAAQSSLTRAKKLGRAGWQPTKARSGLLDRLRHAPQQPTPGAHREHRTTGFPRPGPAADHPIRLVPEVEA